jgi:hypothetical protein
MQTSTEILKKLLIFDVILEETVQRKRRLLHRNFQVFANSIVKSDNDNEAQASDLENFISLHVVLPMIMASHDYGDMAGNFILCRYKLLI